MTQGLPFTIPRDPAEFIALMEGIWDIEMVPAGDGGIMLHCTTLYDEWHDAIKVARAIGLARTGGTRIDGDDATVFRWPNGDGVAVKNEGDGIKKASRFGRRVAVIDA